MINNSPNKSMLTTFQKSHSRPNLPNAERSPSPLALTASQIITPGPGHYEIIKNAPTVEQLVRIYKSRTPVNRPAIKPAARECSFAIEHSGEPYKISGAIDPNPKINPPLMYQRMFRDDKDVIWSPDMGTI